MYVRGDLTPETSKNSFTRGENSYYCWNPIIRTCAGTAFYFLKQNKNVSASKSFVVLEKHASHSPSAKIRILYMRKDVIVESFVTRNREILAQTLSSGISYMKTDIMRLRMVHTKRKF